MILWTAPPTCCQFRKPLMLSRSTILHGLAVVFCGSYPNTQTQRTVSGFTVHFSCRLLLRFKPSEIAADSPTLEGSVFASFQMDSSPPTRQACSKQITTTMEATSSMEEMELFFDRNRIFHSAIRERGNARISLATGSCCLCVCLSERSFKSNRSKTRRKKMAVQCKCFARRSVFS